MNSSASTIPFNDLSRTPVGLMREIEAAVARVLASGWYVLGPEHDAFEGELAQYIGSQHVVLLGNGTDALELGLAALGVTLGDRVITVANAGAYATVAMRLLGAIPVFADVSPETHLMTVETFEAALASSAEQPRAVVVTHLYGAVADVEGIAAVAHRHGIAVLEDCAQSLGARRGGRLAGTTGDIATTSFYPTKNLGALGDGGAVYTNDSALADAVRRMRQYGWTSKYRIEVDHGRNSRLDELQAAILRVKLPHLDEWNERRRAIHTQYQAASSSLVHSTDEAFIAHLAVATSSQRDRVRERLASSGVSTDVHYPLPDHRQGFPVALATAPLPVTERLAGEVFSVPMFPQLTASEIDRISEALAAAESADG